VRHTGVGSLERGLLRKGGESRVKENFRGHHPKTRVIMAGQGRNGFTGNGQDYYEKAKTGIYRMENEKLGKVR